MNIGSGFMAALIGRIIRRVIRKKVGYDIDIIVNEINVTFDGEKAHVHLNADAETSKDELLKIVKKAGL